MGIGGGNFMLVYLKESKTSFTIDSRETAPSGSSETMFINKPGASLTG
jgi:gamma-glutamyltranspeptidase